MTKKAEQIASKAPLRAFAMAAAADWASTGFVLRHPGMQEHNPTISWAKSPAGIIGAGAGIDAMGAYAWMKATGHHPTLQATGFLVAAAFRVYLVINNVRQDKRNDRPS